MNKTKKNESWRGSGILLVKLPDHAKRNVKQNKLLCDKILRKGICAGISCLLTYRIQISLLKFPCSKGE